MLLKILRQVSLVFFGACTSLFLSTDVFAAPDNVDEIVVASQRREQAKLQHAGNVVRLDKLMLDKVLHQHIHELLTRVPGVWINRVSGQEHLTAIRSPVLTGAGSCGGFLFLEDGIPIRPAGFCNVNQFIEIVTEQAQAIEVIRGPGNALYGSNALHGIVNAIMPSPVGPLDPSIAIELGANNYFRARAQLPLSAASPWLASLVYADDSGFRDDSGYSQGKLHLKRAWALARSDLLLGFSATNLSQQTAGFIVGEDAYKDPEVNRSNANPEAFRKASSQRIYMRWYKKFGELELDVRPFVRSTDMDFLQHFLPGQPLEQNGHISAGLLLALTITGESQQTIVGIDLEWSDMFLKETQEDPAQGSAFVMETRPQGKHYDYDVSSSNIAPYLQTDIDLSQRWSLSAGIRFDYIRYEYRNRMLTGNTRDDGTECGFGGCLYTRPASRADSYSNIAPNFSLLYTVNPRTTAFVKLARGFRAPQTTELYRLQSGQTVADLDSEQLDSLEFGLATSGQSISADFALFIMRKHDSIFRDSEGFNVSGARTRHRGIEVGLDMQLHPQWLLKVDGSYALHEYDFDTVAARGESFVSGRDVDTAPRWLGSIELEYDSGSRLRGGLQWTTIGAYYLDAENQFRYPGHSIANLRMAYQFSPTLGLTVRLNNIADKAIADRADYAFGNYRYWPGRGRELFIEFRYSPQAQSAVSDSTSN